MKSNLATFGRTFSPEGLKLAREKAGISQLALGYALFQKGSHTIARIESGDRIPTPAVIMDICRILGCSIDDVAPKLPK